MGGYNGAADTAVANDGAASVGDMGGEVPSAGDGALSLAPTRRAGAAAIGTGVSGSGSSSSGSSSRRESGARRFSSLPSIDGAGAGAGGGGAVENGNRTAETGDDEEAAGSDIDGDGDVYGDGDGAPSPARRSSTLKQPYVKPTRRQSRRVNL